MAGQAWQAQHGRQSMAGSAWQAEHGRQSMLGSAGCRQQHFLTCSYQQNLDHRYAAALLKAGTPFAERVYINGVKDFLLLLQHCNSQIEAPTVPAIQLCQQDWLDVCNLTVLQHVMNCYGCHVHGTCCGHGGGGIYVVVT